MFESILGTIDFEALAAALQGGDKKAAEKIFDYFNSKIYAFVLVRINDKEVAEDITQSVFLKIIEKIESFDSKKGNFPGWVWQIVRNTLVDHYRTKKTVSLETLSLDGEKNTIDIVDDGQSPFRDMRVQELMASIKKLDEAEQEIFTLYYLSSLNYKEISNITGKKEGALRIMLYRIRKQLKQDLYEK
jgi:RNA polymerase sigma-70 factor (ECF subfamily)